MNKQTEALKKINRWQWLAWLLVVYAGFCEYGRTHSVLSALWSSLGTWALITVGGLAVYQKIEDEDL